MAEWVVNCVGRKRNGSIAEVGIRRIDGTFGMDRRSVAQVVMDIENGDVYRVRRRHGPKIHVVNSRYGRYIRSNANNNETDNLGNLSECRRRRN